MRGSTGKPDLQSENAAAKLKERLLKTTYTHATQTLEIMLSRLQRSKEGMKRHFLDSHVWEAKENHWRRYLAKKPKLT